MVILLTLARTLDSIAYSYSLAVLEVFAVVFTHAGVVIIGQMGHGIRNDYVFKYADL